jgi:mono/diheme cytochrome c family protein
LAAALAGGIAVFAGWRSAIDPIRPPAASSFDPVRVKRGAELAAIGGCGVCHTAPGGRPFAGGLAVPTPFGTIFSTNITPDIETGIGRWSEAAFQRAMREGIRRDGQYLYPAFPYDHFTLVSDDDDRSLYAYLMTRDAVRALPRPNDLPFPLNVRLVMFGWNFLFFRQGPFRADAGQSETWNRGAYLAEGLGHCGACHTPRNFLGAEKTKQEFAGGEVEGWTADALNASSPAPLTWNADALTRYLSRGFDETHGVARGPMAPVAQGLRSVLKNDVRAIATYIVAAMANARTTPQPVAQQAEVQSGRGKTVAASSADSQAEILSAAETNGNERGALIYAAACAGCHQGPRAMPYGGIDLALSSGISGPSSQNLINVVLYGLPAAEGARSPIMPGFAASISDDQLVALVAYLRAHFSDRAPWTDIESSLHSARNPARMGTATHAPTGQAARPSNQRIHDGEAQR